MTKFAGCVIRDETGRILLLHRNTPELIWWELPGGKVNSGEDSAESAIREVREETGLEVEIERPIGEARFLMSGGDEYVYDWYEARVMSGAPSVLEPDKHDAVRYVDVFRAESSELSPNVLNLLAYFAESRDA